MSAYSNPPNDTKQLSFKTLERLPREVRRPAYDPRKTTVGIVHLGVGAFHRAHQAVYLDDFLARDPQWAIAGASAAPGRHARGS